MTGPDDEEIIAALASSPGDPPTTDLFSRVAEGARRRRHRHVFVAATSAAVVVTAVAVMPTLLHRTTAPVAAPPAGGISTPPTCAPTRSVAPSADARKVGRLLPGTPAEGVLCVYALRTESGDPSGQLSGQISLTGRTLSDVVAAAHALVPTTAVASCPAPDSADVLTFAFPDESTISLDISCAMVWQGSGPHAMLADPLASQLQVLEAKATEDAPSPAAGSSIAPAGSALVSGAATALPGQPVSPDSLAIASDGTLYVADGLLDVVFARSPSGGFSVVAGTGITGYSGDGGPATSAELNMPRGMVVEPDGTLLIADTGNNRVRAVSPAGVITTVADNGRGGPQDVLARAPDAVLDQPADVNLDPHGNLLIVTSTEVVRMTSDGSLTVVAGGTPGGLVGIGGPASAGSADLPNGVAASNDGGIYISGEATKALLHVTASGTLGVVGSGDDFYPRGFGGLRNAADGSVIAMNGQQVLRYRGTTPSLVYDFGSQPYFGDVHAFIPNGLAVSSSGDIYVDTDGNSGWADRPAIVRIDTHNHATTIWEGPPAAGPWSPPPSVMPRHS